MSAEAKVGMFFLIAVVLIGVIAFYMGDFYTRVRSYPVTAYFENIQGLTSGAEVRMAGVKIGRVVGVTLTDNPRFPKRPAAVKMVIHRDALIYQNDQFVIQQGALLGDKYVEVIRTEATPKTRLGPSGEVAGGKAQGIEDLTQQANALVKEARRALAVMERVFASEYNQEALRTILGNVVSATGKADILAAQALRLAEMLSRQAADAGPNVTRLAANLAQASEGVQGTVAMVRELLITSPVPRDMTIASGNVRDATQDMAQISKNMAQLLATPESRQKIESAMDNLHASTAHLARVTAQADKLLGDGTVTADMREAICRLREAAVNISHIAETYDQVLTDPKFTEDLKGTMSAARQAAEAGGRALEKAETSLDRVDRTMDSVTRATRVVSPDRVRVRGSLEANAHTGLHSDVDVDLQYGRNPNTFLRVGMKDLGDTNRINLQWSFDQGRDRIRAGLIGSELGVGYDYAPHQRFNVEAEAWDPDDLHIDLRGAYGLSPDADFLFGFTDIGSGTNPFVGVRYRLVK